MKTHSFVAVEAAPSPPAQHACLQVAQPRPGPQRRPVAAGIDKVNQSPHSSHGPHLDSESGRAMGPRRTCRARGWPPDACVSTKRLQLPDNAAVRVQDTSKRGPRCAPTSWRRGWVGGPCATPPPSSTQRSRPAAGVGRSAPQSEEARRSLVRVTLTNRGEARITAFAFSQSTWRNIAASTAS